MSVTRFRQSYQRRPDLLGHVFGLLELAFPGAGLSAQNSAARLLGMYWDEVTTPFVYFEDSQLVSHIGVLNLPLVFDGVSTDVGGIHAVSTHPDFRRRGHYRAVMEEALAWASERYTTLQLITAQPELYEPFGFRVIPECRFVTPWTKGATPSRLHTLDARRLADQSLVHKLLLERTALSQRLGVVRERAVFLFNEARRPLHYLPDLDVLLSFELAGTTLQLFDIVGHALPPLTALVNAIPQPIERIEVYFTPDRLDASFSPEPHVLNDDDHLMAKGPYPPEGALIMLPRTARC